MWFCALCSVRKLQLRVSVTMLFLTFSILFYAYYRENLPLQLLSPLPRLLLVLLQLMRRLTQTLLSALMLAPALLATLSRTLLPTPPPPLRRISSLALAMRLVMLTPLLSVLLPQKSVLGLSPLLLLLLLISQVLLLTYPLLQRPVIKLTLVPSQTKNLQRS